MQTRTHFKRRLGISAIIASASAMAGAFAFSGPSYYARINIPDFDQERQWLPNGGAMHCVPTSYADTMKYMAANGLPNMDSGYGNSYDSVTSFINYLGQKLETDSETGTSPESAYDYMSVWTIEHSNVIMLNAFYGPDWNWGPE